MQEMWVQSLGGEDPLEKGMTAHSSILAWRILWTEEPSRPQYMRSQRVGHRILQARILEWAVMPFSRGSSPPRDWTHISCIGRQILYHLSHKGSPFYQLTKYKRTSRSGLTSLPAQYCPDSILSFFLLLCSKAAITRKEIDGLIKQAE